MKHTLLTVALALSFGFAGAATNAKSGMSRDEYKAQKDRIEADYKAAKAQCDSLKANAKDVCVAQAKGKENVAKAELEAKYEPSPRHDAKVVKEKADADYKVAKEKCDDLSGNAKSACVKDAKAAYETAKGHSKAVKVSEQAEQARADATKAAGAPAAAGDDAQYTAAKIRCDAMTGAARDSCMADAKKRFGKM